MSQSPRHTARPQPRGHQGIRSLRVGLRISPALRPRAGPSEVRGLGAPTLGGPQRLGQFLAVIQGQNHGRQRQDWKPGGKREKRREDGGQTDGEGRRADTALQREEDKEGSRVITRMEVKERSPGRDSDVGQGGGGEMKNMPRVRPAERRDPAGPRDRSEKWEVEGGTRQRTLVLGGEPGRAVAQASRPGPGESPLPWPLPPPSCSTQPVCERWLVPIL